MLIKERDQRSQPLALLFHFTTYQTPRIPALSPYQRLTLQLFCYDAWVNINLNELPLNF